ncbi:MAG: sensor histidine kinase [Spirochaetales bacterium]|nr:sensor histidine kinase [Spirochaetales bacterium]
MMRFTSLGNRIFTTMIIISMGTILTLSLMFTYISRRVITENLSSILKEMVVNKSIEMENLLGDATRMTLMLANDASIQKILRQPKPDDLAEVYTIELELDNRLSFIQNYTSHVFGFYIIGANGMQFKSNFSSPLYENWQGFDWYKRIIASQEPIWFEPHNGSFTVNTIGQPLVTLGQRIVDKSTGRILGVMLTDIEVSVLNRLISAGLGDSGTLTLYNQNRNPVSSTDSEQLTIPYPSGQKRKNTDHIYINSFLSEFNWELMGIIHTNTIRDSIMQMMSPLFIFFIILVIIDFLTTLSFVNRVTSPLRDLTHVMQVVEQGDLNVAMPPHPDDDIGYLYDNFNMMISRVKALMKDLYEEHEKLRVSEMRTLEAQINPHFLYNTLDSIIWLARNNQSEEVTKLVYSLTNLLRIGLNKGRAVVSIREEIEHITNYMTIQEIRFGDDFTFSMDIPDVLMECKTVKLILQPLIENAIYHGVMKREDQGEIRLTADYTDNEICFRVNDNGPGISEEECRQVREYLDISKESERGFGLRNVNMRIKLYFGQQYGLDFESKPDRGTQISARIPRM